MALKGINNNVDLACAGLPDAAPSSILASPLASICLQKLHKTAAHAMLTQQQKSLQHAQHGAKALPVQSVHAWCCIG